MTRVISVGLDGAAWPALDRLIADGRLPNLEAIVAEGATAPLRTIHPPVTCPAWRCSTSGKNPGKLGVFWWLGFDRETGTTLTPDATSFDTADIWDYLSAAGHRCAVINVPMTYPPTPLNGVMVAGFGAPFELSLTGAASITYPPSFQTELRDRFDWRVGVDDITTSGGLERAYDVIRSRFEVALDLLGEGLDYLHLTVFYINMLQHHYGDSPETVRAWELIDGYLGRLRQQNALVILYSDHGHTAIERTFALNRWLVNQGYLTLNLEASGWVRGRGYDFLERLGVSPRGAAKVVRTALPSPLAERVIAAGAPVSTADLTDAIDWSTSDAVALSQGPLYLNHDRLGDEVEPVRNRLRAELAAVTHAGEPILDEVLTAEAAYTGRYVEDGPDLVVVPNDGWEVYGGLVPSVVERQPNAWTSGNHSVGILTLVGPGVEPVDLGERSILDIMPTILRYLDSSVPVDIDGMAIEAAFAEGLPATGTCQPISPGTVDTNEADPKLETRLESLGYLQ